MPRWGALAFTVRWRPLLILVVLLISARSARAQQERAVAFSDSIRPLLQEHCSDCHNEDNAATHVNFLVAQSFGDIQKHRGDWVKIAAQLRNKTMPPEDPRITDADRLRVANWIDEELIRTACDAGDFAGRVTTRRLNRREYRNTVRDLLGVDFNVVDFFPADSTGGAGFDTNGDTLYTPPLLIEKYVEAAQQIVESIVVSPPLNRTFPAAELQVEIEPVPIGETPRDVLSVTIPVYVTGRYTLRLARTADSGQAPVFLNVDNIEAGEFAMPTGRGGFRGGGGGGRRRGGGDNYRRVEVEVELERGTRFLTIVSKDGPVGAVSLTIESVPEPVTAEKRSLHYRLLGVEPGETPLNPRVSVERLLAGLLPKAYRRPIDAAEIAPFMDIYDRAAERHDPYEECVKLVLKSVLVSPDFLFRRERQYEEAGIYQLGQYELAARLSYFLWSAPPDEELVRLAAAGMLQEPVVLREQIDRLLDSPRSRTFMTAFVGQWLGTERLGGQVAPVLSGGGDAYDAETAADMRAEPVRMFEYILADNRSLLELLDSDYSFVTERLAKLYQLEGQVDVAGKDFQKVVWPDRNRGGLLGMGGVLAMGSSRRDSSPILRGAWTLETILGVQVPPPPPNAGQLGDDEALANLTIRQQLEAHRRNQTCAACHNLMDPIGLGLENFDWIGRWRDADANGVPIVAGGVLPSGEEFSGPEELRKALLTKDAQFIRHLTAKVLGYSLGRALQDGDSCTIQQIIDRLAADGYRGRTLIHEVVLSIPFRNTQGGEFESAQVQIAGRRFEEKILDCAEDRSCQPDAAE